MRCWHALYHRFYIQQRSDLAGMALTYLALGLNKPDGIIHSWLPVSGGKCVAFCTYCTLDYRLEGTRVPFQLKVVIWYRQWDNDRPEGLLLHQAASLYRNRRWAPAILAILVRTRLTLGQEFGIVMWIWLYEGVLMVALYMKTNLDTSAFCQ